MQVDSEEAIVLKTPEEDLKYCFKNWDTQALYLKGDMLLVKGSRIDDSTD